MNAQVTVLKSAQREAVATPLIAEELAQFAGAFSTERIPAAVTARAKHLILDAVGIALASTTYDFAHRAMTAISGLAGSGDFRRHRHAGAVAAARRGAAQRHSGSRPRLRRHP